MTRTRKRGLTPRRLALAEVELALAHSARCLRTDATLAGTLPESTNRTPA